MWRQRCASPTPHSIACLHVPIPCQPGVGCRLGCICIRRCPWPCNPSHGSCTTVSSLQSTAIENATYLSLCPRRRACQRGEREACGFGQDAGPGSAQGFTHRTLRHHPSSMHAGPFHYGCPPDTHTLTSRRKSDYIPTSLDPCMGHQLEFLQSTCCKAAFANASAVQKEAAAEVWHMMWHMSGRKAHAQKRAPDVFAWPALFSVCCLLRSNTTLNTLS